MVKLYMLSGNRSLNAHAIAPQENLLKSSPQENLLKSTHPENLLKSSHPENLIIENHPIVDIILHMAIDPNPIAAVVKITIKLKG